VVDPGVAVDDWAFEPDVVYEVSGTRAGLETALALLPPGGRLVLVGLQGEPVPMDARRIALAELEVIGPNAHVCGVDLPTSLELLAARGSWGDVAPVALSLDDLVEEGLRPLAERRAPGLHFGSDGCQHRAMPGGRARSFRRPHAGRRRNTTAAAPQHVATVRRVVIRGQVWWLQAGDQPLVDRRRRWVRPL
jgi:hypothetical protein